MTFKTRPNKYCISIAPTSGARCRRCRNTILKGAVRIATHAFVRPQRATVFFRCAPACIDRQFAAAVLRQYGRADRVPSAASVPHDEASDIKRVLQELGAAEPPPPPQALAAQAGGRQTLLPFAVHL